MLQQARLLLARFRKKRGDASTKQDSQISPSVSWLLAHREERIHQRALCKGGTSTASLYRMYEYLVIGYTIGLRTEIEYFFNRHPWAVSAIPDPKDPDPERYAILAVLPCYLVMAFNRLIERGLPRDSPAIITPEIEAKLKSREKRAELGSKGVTTVAALGHTG